MARGRVTRVAVLGLRAFDGAQGGIETHVRTVISAIAEHRDDFHFTVIERKRYSVARRQRRNIEVVPIWSPRAAWLETIVHSFLGVLYAAVTRPDVLHVHGIGPSLVLPFARLFGLRVVSTHHGEDYLRDKWGRVARALLRVGELSAVRLAHRCIVIAPAAAGRLAARFKNKVAFIPNPIPDLDRTHDEEVLAGYGLKPGEYLVHVGRIVPEKKQLELIHAYSASGVADWPLVLVGGADHRSRYAEQVLDLALKTPNVRSVGIQQGAALSTLLGNAGGFILPSSHEGLPIALLEAMSCGLPLVVSDIESLAALHLPEDCYFSVADDAALRAAIRRLRENDGRRRDWTDFLGRFEIATVRDATAVVYQRAMK